MKIGVEVQALMGSKTGVAYYTENILRSLAQIDSGNEYTLVLFKFFTNPFSPPMRLPSNNFSYGLVRVVPGRFFGKLLWHNLLPPMDVFLGRKDWYIFPNYIVWPLAFSKAAVVIYDMSYILHPQYVAEDTRKILARNMKKSVRKAKLIITISQNSKREILDYYPAARNKVVVAPPAVNLEVFRPADERSIKTLLAKYNLPKNFILYVGTIEPRKNIVGIVEAYAKLSRNLQVKHSLVLAGGKGWKDESIHSAITKAQKSGSNIILPGYIDEADLATLYSAAKVFVFPSHYEGFGMPALEAMACETPVLASNNSSLPEVCGTAALMVESTSIDQISEGLYQILTDEKLCNRLIEAGRVQVKGYDWKASARTILIELEARK